MYDVFMYDILTDFLVVSNFTSPCQPPKGPRGVFLGEVLLGGKNVILPP
jgi:hypothetical protein